MKENNIQTAKCGKYTFSQVVPKPVVTFDTDTFVKENENLLSDYTTTTETESLDLDLLKEKFPEVYDIIRHVTKTVTVDTKKLQKGAPSVYSKYTTEVKSDKKITLKILTAKK